MLLVSEPEYTFSRNKMRKNTVEHKKPVNETKIYYSVGRVDILRNCFDALFYCEMT